MDDNPSDEGSAGWFLLSAGQLIAPIAVMFALMPIFVGLRLWSQYLQREAIDASCLCIVGGFALVVALSGLGLSTIPLGLGQEAEYTDDQSQIDLDSEAILKALWIIVILYTASLALSKFAILLVFKKVFPTHAMRFGTIAIGILVLTWAVVAIFINAFACNPPSDFWRRFTTSAHGRGVSCINHSTFFSYNIIPNIVANILMLVLPIREVSKIHMTRRSKLQVSAVFALGSIVTVVAIVRFAVTLDSNVYKEGLPWMVAETGLSVICACMPGMGPAVRKLGSFSSKSNLTTKTHPRPKPMSHALRLSSTSATAPSTQKQTIPKRILTRAKALVGWQGMPVIHHDYPLPNRKRTPAEMEEFGWLYEYSGRDPFRQDAYAQMTDTELFGGIHVEHTVDVTVEPNIDAETPGASNEAIAMPVGVYDGRAWRSRGDSAV